MGVALKHCPFCGSDEVGTLITDDGPRRLAIVCRDCSASAGDVMLGDEASIEEAEKVAVACWNTRAIRRDPRHAAGIRFGEVTE